VADVQLRWTTFAELLPGVADGRWTISYALFITPERALQVAFGRPIWALADGFVLRADAAPLLDSYEAIAQRGAVLGVVRGQVQHDTALRAGVAPDRVREFATQTEVIDALLSGRVDAYASTAVGNRTFVRALNQTGLRAVNDAAPGAPSRRGAPLGAYCFHHANVLLRQRFDAYLAQFLGSALHRQQVAAWGLSAQEIDPVLALQPPA
jgi:polar amino acid transport system substrate-binding protein